MEYVRENRLVCKKKAHIPPNSSRPTTTATPTLPALLSV